MSKIKILAWETIISSADGLFFGSFHDNGVLYVIYKDKEDNQYEIVCDRPYSYRMSDEELLIDYWNLKPKGSGWTSIITGVMWENISYCFIDDPNTQHYLIASYDLCLELLSDIPPTIRKITKPTM